MSLPDDEPIATYYVHQWGGKECFCLGDDCPLCEIGDEPCYRVCFDVIELDD